MQYLTREYRANNLEKIKNLLNDFYNCSSNDDVNDMSQ